MRNGYCPTTINTTAGPVTLERPKLRGTTERFASQLFGTGVLRTNALEALVIASFVRGLSVRDVEATLTEALGEQASVSKSAVSRICSELKEQFQTWSRRRLDDLTLDYLFLDASHFKYHPNAGAEPVLAAWGIDTDGKPVFVGLDTAARGPPTGRAEQSRCPAPRQAARTRGHPTPQPRTLGLSFSRRDTPSAKENLGFDRHPVANFHDLLKADLLTSASAVPIQIIRRSHWGEGTAPPVGSGRQDEETRAWNLHVATWPCITRREAFPGGCSTTLTS